MKLEWAKWAIETIPEAQALSCELKKETMEEPEEGDHTRKKMVFAFQ